MVAHPQQLPLPIDYAPDIVRDHGYRDAHSRPLVSLGKDADGDVRSRRVAPAEAWTYPSIELRAGNSHPVLVFDLDGRDAMDRVQARTAAGLPHPNWVTLREASGGIHVVYTLAAPVHRGAAGRERPLAFLARVSEWYGVQLEADAGYGGVLAHNPVPPAWSDLHTYWGREEPYELRELAEPIPKRWRRPHIPRTAIGRNVALFEAGMRWAGSHQNLGHDVLPFLRVANRERFAEHPAGPLPDGELRSTAKSIERYRREWTARGKFYTPEERQAWGRRRGQAGGRARRERNAERNAAIVAAYAQGVPTADLAALHGVDARTVQRVVMARSDTNYTGSVPPPSDLSAFRDLARASLSLIEMLVTTPGTSPRGLGLTPDA